LFQIKILGSFGSRDSHFCLQKKNRKNGWKQKCIKVISKFKISPVSLKRLTDDLFTSRMFFFFPNQDFDLRVFFLFSCKKSALIQFEMCNLNFWQFPYLFWWVLCSLKKYLRKTKVTYKKSLNKLSEFQFKRFFSF